MPRSHRPIRDVVAELGELGERASQSNLPRGYGLAAIDAAIAAGEIRYRPDGTLEPVPRMGRPPRSASAATRRIDLRATPEEETLWRAAAEASGLGLRRWIADQATTAARKASRSR